MPAPALARPVFSTEDSRLIRRAVVEFIKNNQDDMETPKFVNLHHRLGRMG